MIWPRNWLGTTDCSAVPGSPFNIPKPKLVTASRTSVVVGSGCSGVTSTNGTSANITTAATVIGASTRPRAVRRSETQPPTKTPGTEVSNRMDP